MEKDLFEYARTRDFGEIHLLNDNKTGLQAIVAIHSLKLGPALGGCRCLEYSSTEDALNDAMRLARGMSFKSAIVDIPIGGGKSVLLKPSHIANRKAYFEAFGRFIHSLNGNYITAIDSGTTVEDMDIIGTQTPYVASLSAMDGEPSPATAESVFQGIQAAVHFKLNRTSLEGLHVAIQGLGQVGYYLAQKLHQAGVRLSVTDVNPEAVARCVNELDAHAVDPQAIYHVPCDVFSPCALGAIINDDTLEALSAPIIAGSANNQLEKSRHGVVLHQNNILYAPDYVINAGGLIFAAGKYMKSSEQEITDKINHINDTLMAIFERSATENLPTSKIADAMAAERL